MRIKYHPQHNSRRRFSRLVLFIGILAVLLAGLSLTGQMQYITKYLYASALSGVTVLADKTNDIHDVLTPKATLLQENQKLRTELQKLKIVSQYNQALAIENNHLKALLTTPIGYAKSPAAHPADTLLRIIDYKSATYGTILTKVVEGSEPKVGALAHFGKLAIGTATEVNGDYVLIKLFTASGNSHSVLVGNISATFYGDSNDTGKVTLSRTESVQVGEVVTLPESGGLIIGTVEEVEHNIEESTQTLMIRSPIKVSQLQFISITND